jgi:pyruvate kinase
MAKRPYHAIDRDETLERIFQQRMMVTTLARALGLTTGAVSQWRRVPERHLAAVARLTRVSKRRLRPDLYRETCQAAAE